MMETLADRVKRLRQEAERTMHAQSKRAYQSVPARTARDLAGLAWFLTGVGIGLWWIWERVVMPVWRFARKPGVWLARRYVDLWHWATVIIDPYGKPVFSKTRAGFMVIATGVFWFFMLWPLLGLATDSVIYLLTAQVDEHVILLSSQQLDSEKNTHMVEGCAELPCSDRNSLYFKVRGSLFNDLWTIAHLRGIQFYPDSVAAPIPMDVSECVITSYGLRQNLIAGFHLFPEILAVRSCNVVTATSKEKRQ